MPKKKNLFLCTRKPGLNLPTEAKSESTTRKDLVSLNDSLWLHSLICNAQKVTVGCVRGGDGDT